MGTLSLNDQGDAATEASAKTHKWSRTGLLDGRVLPSHASVALLEGQKGGTAQQQRRLSLAPCTGVLESLMRGPMVHAT